MKNKVLLPTRVPIYSTYHYQMIPGVVAGETTQMMNWYYNNCIMLSCIRDFLKKEGDFAVRVEVENTNRMDNPHFERIEYNLRFMKSHVHQVIKNMLNEGFYVDFNEIDDYYIQGKSWYGQRHFMHDGLICGYDDEDRTYSIMAYDSSWLCRLFKSPQRCLEEGMNSFVENGNYGIISAVKVIPFTEQLNLKKIKEKLKAYLCTQMDMFPLNEYWPDVFGIAVHQFIGIYLDMLYHGDIPYNKKDRRIFRLIWEHKKCMYERIKAIENALQQPGNISSQYLSVVQISDQIRFMYAKFFLKQDNEVLRIMRAKLLDMSDLEEKILKKLVDLLESGGY